MSSNYFFTKWKKVLQDLEAIVNTDRTFQITKQHDDTLCQAVGRLTGVVGLYISLYNEAVNCLRNNLQVQKQRYMQDVVNSISERIVELKSQLRKLENSNYQFLSEGLTLFNNTPYDVEMNDIPEVTERCENVNTTFENIKMKATEKIEDMKRKAKEEEDKAVNELILEKIDTTKWWDLEAEETAENIMDEELDITVKLSDESMLKKNMAALIQAHERSRKVIFMMTQQNQRRKIWQKELEGTLQPQLRLDLRERAARIIEFACREYFKLKRIHAADCRREELLGIRYCESPKSVAVLKAEQIRAKRHELKKKYTEEWKSRYIKLKEAYFKLRSGDLQDDCRAETRAWFEQWYKEVQYFYDVPKQILGGSCLITKQEIPTPKEWQELYLQYLQEKKAKNKKSSEQKKRELLEAKEEEMTKRLEEKAKLKLQEQLKKKMMKDPNYQIGYDYPQSTKINNIIQAIHHYKNHWDEFDATEILDAKEKSILSVDNDKIYMEAKIEIKQAADAEMRIELKTLRKTLKKEYKRNAKEMPERMKEKRIKKKKIKRSAVVTIDEDISDRLEELITNGIIMDYPPTKIEDFIGDHNYAGEHFRCVLKRPEAFPGEVRQLWWERCRDTAHGSSRILIVGPRGSSKITLVHAMASVNDAILFELNPSMIKNEYSTTADLKKLAHSVTLCARAVQPSVIYIKHVQRLFYRKTPLEEKLWNLPRMRRYLVRHLCKRIHKEDKISIIGTCVDPWLTKSTAMLKLLPTVVLTPNSNYSTVVKLIKDWMKCNREVPSNFDYHALARCLQGYQLAFLKRSLQDFLSGDVIVKIAAEGLSPLNVFDYILEKAEHFKTDYEKYEKWYLTNTHWGNRESKHISELLEVQAARLFIQEKREKKKKKAEQLVSPAAED